MTTSDRGKVGELEYIASYGDLMDAFGADAGRGAQHWLEHGRFEGRSTTFDALEYIASYPDLLAAFGADAELGVLHYICDGRFEGRAEGFDPAQYLGSNGDLRTAFGTDLEAATRHYIQFGHAEGRPGGTVGAVAATAGTATAGTDDRAGSGAARGTTSSSAAGVTIRWRAEPVRT